ncbi:hypothetical protein [Aquimarina sp. 2201CG5-10]|uniref:hypothetical protein n=1 Tax=Aquimarina callyspongiae TaxID=3098150 RepID=UPI002AB51606|nr:hypothetical protein [Aquimarina sp. 2201CG5-10]MDY8135574.1 hypothetical protein [Aquimarina sp. 2201CG5-10]
MKNKKKLTLKKLKIARLKSPTLIIGGADGQGPTTDPLNPALVCINESKEYVYPVHSQDTNC